MLCFIHGSRRDANALEALITLRLKDLSCCASSLTCSIWTQDSQAKLCPHSVRRNERISGAPSKLCASLSLFWLDEVISPHMLSDHLHCRKNRFLIPGLSKSHSIYTSEVNEASNCVRTGSKREGSGVKHNRWSVTKTNLYETAYKNSLEIEYILEVELLRK